ncbi:MAG: NAD(P)/FAD-dependent oxidoreductase [Burkholderiales bacterium]
MYDAIVVGARCAGAVTAMLLARKGYRVLLTDKADFPSDMPMSTHLVWQAGAERLQRWGLLESIQATNCPALTDVSMNLGGFSLSGRPTAAGEVGIAIAPRRIVLDKLLVDAAVAAGAELHEDFSVTGLLREGERVIGVQGVSSGKESLRAQARLVVGADGSNSRVAREVGAVEYNQAPQVQGTYFSYFSGVDLDSIEFVPRPGRMVYAWRTNDDRTLVGISWVSSDLGEVRQDVEKHFYSELEKLAPDLYGRVREGNRDAPLTGGAAPGFFRKPVGNGWALVGDAGVTMDPITAAGISNAFRDAEFLADAIDEGFSGRKSIDDALAQYAIRRDEAAMPIFGLTCQMASLAAPPAEMMAVFEALRHNQADTDRYFGVFAQTVPVGEFFDPANLQRIVTTA